MSNVRELRPKVGDSEKITINLGYVDLLVQEGFYSNRTDFNGLQSATNSTATTTQ
jgi:hypothetical protein